MGSQFPDEELDKIIREVIGVERKVLLETGNSTSKRNKEIRSIIERRAKEVATHET